MRIEQIISGEFSNWELVALITIKKVMVGNNPRFDRMDIMSYTFLENARKFLYIFDHKKDPSSLENTMQRTIQNLRDKGYIEFLGEGHYRLSNNGQYAINNINPKVTSLYDTLSKMKFSDIDKAKSALFSVEG